MVKNWTLYLVCLKIFFGYTVKSARFGSGVQLNTPTEHSSRLFYQHSDSGRASLAGMTTPGGFLLKAELSAYRKTIISPEAIP